MLVFSIFLPHLMQLRLLFPWDPKSAGHWKERSKNLRQHGQHGSTTQQQHMHIVFLFHHSLNLVDLESIYN